MYVRRLRNTKNKVSIGKTSFCLSDAVPELREILLGNDFIFVTQKVKQSVLGIKRPLK